MQHTISRSTTRVGHLHDRARACKLREWRECTRHSPPGKDGYHEHASRAQSELQQTARAWRKKWVDIPGCRAYHHILALGNLANGLVGRAGRVCMTCRAESSGSSSWVSVGSATNIPRIVPPGGFIFIVEQQACQNSTKYADWGTKHVFGRGGLTATEHYTLHWAHRIGRCHADRRPNRNKAKQQPDVTKQNQLSRKHHETDSNMNNNLRRHTRLSIFAKKS